MQLHQKKQSTNTNGLIYQTTSKLRTLILSTLQPDASTSNSTTYTTIYEVTQHASPSSQALKHKPGKYHDDDNQCIDQSEPEIKKIGIQFQIC